jgi:hypothetical protein
MRFEDEQMSYLIRKLDDIVARKLEEFLDKEIKIRIEADVKTQIDNRLRFLASIRGDSK